MKRAYLIEMTVIRDYARQLFALGVFVAACTCVGMQSVAAAPGVLTCMYFIMGALATSAYDEQNNWGLYRLTMPISRRDVVLGRYGVIATLGIMGMAAGLIGAVALSAIATVAPLPGDLKTALGLSPDNVQAMVFSCALCAVVGSGVAARHRRHDPGRLRLYRDPRRRDREPRRRARRRRSLPRHLRRRLAQALRKA